ncbi:MAG: hypothetical protein NUV91_03895, partial [Candidatus Omnitrophica bacterium]|nr:hypothetical protein [Candidatus Omnitrophota bacterium]
MKNFLHRPISLIALFSFVWGSVFSPGLGWAQSTPAGGQRVSLTAVYHPPLIKGLTIHQENPLLFDFIVDNGQDHLQGQAFEDEATKMIKYFLASLTVPESDQWVNLSPEEPDRIIPGHFGQTEMGRDLLAQDYLLKQLTASLVYPEEELGQKFWKRVYQAAQEKLGTTQIPVNTFNKVWIVPDKASVYENEGKVYVVERTMKVMLEEEYLEKYQPQDAQYSKAKKDQTRELMSQIIREIIVPELEREVNEGKHFATLRQIYNSVILAVWYKKNLRENLLSQAYVNQNKVAGVDLDDKQAKEKIYQQYLEAFRRGVYNYIKEEVDPATKQIIPRKYFSGGATVPVAIREYGVQTAVVTEGANERGGDLQNVNVAVTDRTAVQSRDADGRNEGEGEGGPALRDTGEELRDDQKKVVDDAVAQYYGNGPRSNDQWRREIVVGSEEYRKLDPEGKLQAYETRRPGKTDMEEGVNIYELKGLEELIAKLAAERGVLVPTGLMTHPGRSRANIYLDPKWLATIQGKSRRWRAAWANHELMHIAHR